MIKEVEERFNSLKGTQSSKIYVKKYIDILENENRSLKEENEMLKRKIYGLETKVLNFKEKEEKHYRNQDW